MVTEELGERLRLLTVHAHPDDESSKGAGTMCAYRERGAEVMVVSCTGGERGSLLNEDLSYRSWVKRDIGGARRWEMEQARHLLGFEHRWLGYEDSGFSPDQQTSASPLSFFGIPAEISVQPLVRLIRDFRPHVMITYDENGGYPHPDHMRTHQVALMAYDLAAQTEYQPELGKPWAVSKLYYDQIFNRRRFQAIYDFARAAGGFTELLPRMAEAVEAFKERPYRATARVDISEHFGCRDKALQAHASQVSPDMLFFFIPHEISREAWPWEDYILAHSRVPTEEFEDDLFAGIPVLAAA